MYRKPLFAAYFLIALSLMVFALDIEEIGSYIPGSNPRGIQWIDDDTLGLGSSFGYCFLNLTTRKITTVFPDENVSCRFFDERDKFLVIQGSKYKDSYYYDYKYKMYLLMPDAVTKWKNGGIQFSYFREYYNEIERGYFILDLKESKAIIQTRVFDGSYLSREYPVYSFEGRRVKPKYRNNEYEVSQWIYQPGVNNLEDFFGAKSGNLSGGYPSSPKFTIYDINVFTKEMIIHSDLFYYKVVLQNNGVSIHQIYDIGAIEGKNKTGIISSDLALVSLTPSTYLSRKEWGESIILGDTYYDPFCVYRDDGTIIKQFDRYYIGMSLPVSVNWKRTRIAILCYDMKEKVSCVVVFKVVRDGIVNDSSVRLRSAPGLKGTVQEVLTKDSAVKVLDVSNDKETIGNTSAYWYKVTTASGMEGWVYGAYIDIID